MYLAVNKIVLFTSWRTRVSLKQLGSSCVVVFSNSPLAGDS